MEEVEKLKQKIEEVTDKLDSAVRSVTGGTVFKARIVEGYRITVPEVEREAAGLKMGDLVQVKLRKIEKKL